MIRRTVFGLSLIALVLGLGFLIPAHAEDSKQLPDSTPASNEASDTPAASSQPHDSTGASNQMQDLTGYWRFDPSRSDMPKRPEGGGDSRGSRSGGGGWGGGRGGHAGRGGMGGEGRMGRGRGGDAGEGAGGRRHARLPDLMHVTQATTVVSFEDSTGAVIREIVTVSAKADTFAHAPNAEQLTGIWKGDQLEVERAGRGGSKITETVSLEDKGRLLVIHTKMKPDGDAPSMEFKRVYQRVEG